jgi:transcriptional regulator with XRE-family HTH domain/quercetin dioxygenase-like cupin family protein
MPVFSSHLMNYEGLGLGKRIRAERQRQGQTLRQLSERLGCSEAKLSNIETDKVALDLAELRQIAEALGMALAGFFPPSRVDHHLVTRASVVNLEPVARTLIGPDAGPATHHNPVWPLAELFVGKHIEPVLARIQPLADQDMHFIAHDHEEFMFVLRGEVETLLKTNDGLVRENLRAGDCLYFRSNLPHCHRSTSAQPAETINVMYSMRGAIDPNDAELALSNERYYRRGVYADATMEASEKIALLRRTHGVALADLARDIGIGPRQLAEIERGQTPARIDVLLRLARRFRRPIEYFFSTTLDSQPYYFIQRAGTIRDLLPQYQIASDGTPESATMFRPLAGDFPDRGMHPYYVQVKANGSQPVHPRGHHGQEFVYVLDGEVELVTYGDTEQVELLRAGDSVFLESSIPHLLRGQSRNPFAEISAEIIDVLWSPLGEDYLFRH